MPRAIYIRLSQPELQQLGKMAAEERRSSQEQAAFLVGQGLLRWQALKDFEDSLPPMAGLEVDAA